MQIAALNVRSEADAIAKRLTSKGYAAYVLSPARARRRSTACASASSSRAAKPRRSRRSWKKKSSSSPGLPASPRVRRPPGAQFPEVRTSRLRLDRARAAARRARLRGRPTTRRAFLLGLTTGVVYFTGTLYWITRVMAVYGGLPAWVAVILNAALVAYLALFPAVFAVVMRPRPCRVRRTRAGGGAARVGGDRARTDAYPDRLSLGAARVQPGGSAADRAAREPVWRLRRVGAGRRASAVAAHWVVAPRRSGSAAAGGSSSPSCS